MEGRAGRVGAPPAKLVQLCGCTLVLPEAGRCCYETLAKLRGSWTPALLHCRALFSRGRDPGTSGHTPSLSACKRPPLLLRRGARPL